MVRESRVALAWLVVGVCIAMIWSLSGDEFSANQTSHFIDPLLRSLFPHISRQSLEDLHFAVRKLAHATEYGLLALFAQRAWRLTLDLGLAGSAALALLLVLVVASADELHQSHSAVRMGSGADVVLDLCGGLLAIVLLFALRRAASVVVREG